MLCYNWMSQIVWIRSYMGKSNVVTGEAKGHWIPPPYISGIPYLESVVTIAKDISCCLF